MSRRNRPNKGNRNERIAAAVAIGPLHEAAMRREVVNASARNAQINEKLAPLVITGMVNPKRMVLDLDTWFDRLEVDARYQRLPVSSVINGMERALRAGGLSLAPIILAKRLFVDDHTKPGVLYIVDGQQRVLAHVAAERPVEAICYESETLSSERQAFSVLNMTTQKVNANRLAHAFAGPAFELLRQVDATAGHPLRGRIKWASGGGSDHQCITAMAALKGLGALLVGVPAVTRSTANLFPKLNASYSKAKAEAFFQLLGQAVGNHCPTLYTIALGDAARSHWTAGCTLPTARSLDAMRRTNWRTVVMNKNSITILPIVVEQLRKKWK